MSSLWVGLGGALGSVARHHIGRWAASRAPAFPWGTLLVNLLGCLFIGVLMQLVLRERASETVRLALGTGLLGGFTTYSTFNFETFALAESGAWGRAALYVGVTLLGGLALGAAGWFLGRSL